MRRIEVHIFREMRDDDEYMYRITNINKYTILIIQ